MARKIKVIAGVTGSVGGQALTCVVHKKESDAFPL